MPAVRPCPRQFIQLCSHSAQRVGGPTPTKFCFDNVASSTTAGQCVTPLGRHWAQGGHESLPRWPDRRMAPHAPLEHTYCPLLIELW